MTLVVSRQQDGRISVSFTEGSTSVSLQGQEGQGASWNDYKLEADTQPDTPEQPAPVEPPAAPVEPAATVEQPVEREHGPQDIVPPPVPQPPVETAAQSGDSPTGSSGTDTPQTEGL